VQFGNVGKGRRFTVLCLCFESSLPLICTWQRTEAEREREREGFWRLNQRHLSPTAYEGMLSKFLIKCCGAQPGGRIFEHWKIFPEIQICTETYNVEQNDGSIRRGAERRRHTTWSRTTETYNVEQNDGDKTWSRTTETYNVEQNDGDKMWSRTTETYNVEQNDGDIQRGAERRRQDVEQNDGDIKHGAERPCRRKLKLT
jgi:hypothetical protein